jgi:hypothetical protein
MQKKLIIAFTGRHAVGKTTVANIVAQNLQAAGISVRQIGMGERIKAIARVLTGDKQKHEPAGEVLRDYLGCMDVRSVMERVNDIFAGASPRLFSELWADDVRADNNQQVFIVDDLRTLENLQSAGSVFYQYDESLILIKMALEGDKRLIKHHTDADLIPIDECSRVFEIRQGDLDALKEAAEDVTLLALNVLGWKESK